MLLALGESISKLFIDSQTRVEALQDPLNSQFCEFAPACR